MAVPLLGEREALRRHPELAALVALRRAGWSWTTNRDQHGLTAVIGYRPLGGYIDALYVYHQGSAAAVRMVAGERTGGLVWQYEGRVTDCVDALRELPEPGLRTAPTLVRSRLWLPH